MGKCCLALCAVLLATSCSNEDETLQGSRGTCASGGVFETCDDSEFLRTPEGACMRLVECGAIPLMRPEGDPNRFDFDYDRCVLEIEERSAATQRVITNCIATTKCDALLPQNPNNPDRDQIFCLFNDGAE